MAAALVVYICQAPHIHWRHFSMVRISGKDIANVQRHYKRDLSRIEILFLYENLFYNTNIAARKTTHNAYIFHVRIAGYALVSFIPHPNLQ